MNKPQVSVGQYYDDTTRWYKWVYYDKKSLGMHYGYWDKDTKNKTQALQRPYKEISRAMNLRNGDHVLDAGCGVGGASLWLAESFPRISVTGITLSPVQRDMALNYACQRNLQGRVNFQIANYSSTEFPDNKFSHAFGIESLCHAYPEPGKTYQEIYRLLKPGGKFVIVDGFFLRPTEGQEEHRIANEFCAGYCLDGPCTVADARKALLESGFKDIKFSNWTPHVARSVNEIYWKGRLLTPLFKLGRTLGVISPSESIVLLAANAQHWLYAKGVFVYGMFVATK